jgi:3-deoxy-D-manno-octulosonic-acid transferase
VYLVAALLLAPVWLVGRFRTGKLRTDWGGRFGRTGVLSEPKGPRVLVHAVSVGEVNAIRGLVTRLRDGGAEPVISVTTDTGHARALALFGDRSAVVRYPLDFSWAVRRFLRSVRPRAVVLVELEVWPNFTAACRRSGVPVCVVNGRLTARSFSRYRRLGRLIRPTFGRLAFAAVQSEAYARRFVALGTAGDSVHVTGTMKWDSAELKPDTAAAEALAASMGIDRERPLVVAGSTAPGEHELLREAVPEGVQLLCAPRRPEWFDRAAQELPGCVRRSAGDRGSPTGRYLLDTIGELRAAYALADVAVVGRSFFDLHGSDMMEPIGLGRPTIVGPSVSDFQDTVDVLLAADALVQCTRDHLPAEIRRLLEDDDRRAELVRNAAREIERRRGATDRSAALIRPLLRGG